MLVWSRSGRFVVWLVAALLIGILFLAPLAVILAASLARQWNGVLPTGFTFEWTDLAHQQEQQGTPTLLIFAASAAFVFLVIVTWNDPSLGPGPP